MIDHVISKIQVQTGLCVSFRVLLFGHRLLLAYPINVQGAVYGLEVEVNVIRLLGARRH